MNEEIKDILNIKYDDNYKLLSIDELSLIQDYITDLQQENDKLKEIIKKIKDELFKNQFEFTYYGCWLNIKNILDEEELKDRGDKNG